MSGPRAGAAHYHTAAPGHAVCAPGLQCWWAKPERVDGQCRPVLQLAGGDLGAGTGQYSHTHCSAAPLSRRYQSCLCVCRYHDTTSSLNLLRRFMYTFKACITFNYWKASCKAAASTPHLVAWRDSPTRRQSCLGNVMVELSIQCSHKV